jgi:hypothetical protein
VRATPLLLLSSLLVGCGPEVTLPSLTVAVTTDAAVPADLDTLVIEAERQSHSYAREFDAAALPNFVVLTCDESSDDGLCERDVKIRVAGRLGPTDVKIERTATVSYTPEENRLLRMPLCTSCLEITCGEGETCVRGRCESDTLDPFRLPIDAADLPLDDGECQNLPCEGDCTVCGTCPEVPTISIDAYQIDAHEVTRDEYAAFLAADVSMKGQGETCAFNLNYAPDAECMAVEDVCQGEGCGSHPQVCVDWCDATAYCAWAGKRLCGDIAGGGLDPTLRDDPTASQWFRACSAAGARDYPYGPDYEAQRCNGKDADTTSTIAVGTAMCATPEGIADLSGNVAEWEDSCGDSGDPRFNDCTIRGGSYISSPSGLLCAHDPTANREDTRPYLGFRCCSR